MEHKKENDDVARSDQPGRSTAEYKWRRLRAWVRDRLQNAEAGAKSRTMSMSVRYHEHRAEAFKAVLIVMDMENRRARRLKRKPGQEPPS